MIENFSMAIAGLLTVALNYIALYMIFPCRYNKRVSIAVTVLYVAAFYSFLIYFNQAAETLGGFRGLIHFPLILLLFRGQFFQKIFAAFLAMLVTGLQIQPVKLIAKMFAPDGSGEYYLCFTVILLAVYAVYAFIIFKYGRRFFEKLFISGRRLEWGIYSLGAFFSFSVMAILQNASINTWMYLTLLLFILWSLGILCFAIVNTHEKTKQKLDAEFARGIVSSGRDHYQKMDEMYDKLRALRHDYKYHLSAARKMLGSGDADGTDQYLTVIENQLDEHELKNYCTNTVINALIAGYAERCAKLHIDFEVDISLLKTLVIPNYELCVIFGNLLENAVEACEKLESGRKIELATQKIPAQLLFMVKNSFDGKVSGSNGNPVSTKINGGFGLKSVREVIARHGGNLHIEWDEDTFTVYLAVRF